MPKGIYKRQPFSEQHKQKLSDAKKGKPLSDNHRASLSIALTGRRFKCKKRKVLSIEHKRKLSELAKLRNPRTGKDCNFWKGGVSFEKYTSNWNEELKEKIRFRDNYLCYICGKHQDKQKHSVHHIDYDKKNLSLDNLITLCRCCHCRTNHNRIMWKSFFGLSRYIIRKYFTAH
jgi:5-methylcytosine-specific restriction endonuclease McrA